MTVLDQFTRDTRCHLLVLAENISKAVGSGSQERH